MVDYDGSYKYSPVVQVGPSAVPVALALEIMGPSPAREWVAVRVENPSNDGAILTVHDAAGRMITEIGDGLQLQNGIQALTIPVESWHSGAYFFVLRTRTDQVTKKLLILH
jgi:hypothetical protein